MGERVIVDVSGERIAPGSRPIFGALIEHIGTTIYGGLWDEPRDRPRPDAMRAARAMGVSMLRYPGGCFSSWYHWRDGVGPKRERPHHRRQFWTPLDPRLGPPEPNLFGTDEYLRYCLDIGAEPYLAVNLGSATPEEAAAWVHYCNVDRNAPRPVTWWAIGNETWGASELGHCPPQEYGERYLAFATAMRAVDPDIRLVGVGGSGRSPEDGQAPGDDHDIPASTWNPGVLSVAGTEMDALSVHWYFPGLIGRPLDEGDADYLQMASAPDLLEAALTTTLGQISEVLGEESRLPISLDEWNRMVELEDHFSCNHRLVDGVFFGGCFNVLLRHADRVTVALLAQLVNCLAPIQASPEGCFVTAAHLVAALYAEFGRGESVRVMVDTDDMDVPPMENLEPTVWEPDAAVRTRRRSSLVDAAATSGALGTSVFLVNRSLRDAQPVLVRGLGPGGSGRFRYVHGDGPFASNSLENPTELGYRQLLVEIDDKGEVTIEVPPHTVGVAVVR